MAYATGSAVDLAALLTAIRTACTSNGWTLSGEVLHKGAIFIRTQEVTGTLTFLGGTGIDGSNVLTGAGPAIVRMRPFADAFTFPMQYEVHINTGPDEVYVVTTYNVDCYQWAAWGVSDVAGITGTGVWYGATQSAINNFDVVIQIPGGDTNPGIWLPPVLFGANSGNDQNTFIHHDLDGSGWNPVGGGSHPKAWLVAGTLLGILPSAWNSETVLVPIQVWVDRASGNKVSLAADVAHARYLRNDFHDGGDIITLGADQWKVYPWLRKNASQRNGGSQHSGTFGWAVRYTGP